MKNKLGFPFWSKFNLATKILAVFLTLSVISLGIVGAFTAVNLRELGKYALDRQESLGRSAIQDSSAALQKLGEDTIEQKARDVARQLDIYIQAHPEKNIADLRSDPAFRSLAVQAVGQTGYTLVMDANSGLYYFHKFPEVFENKKAEDLFTDPANPYYNPPVWHIQNQVITTHQDYGGYFDWKEPTGEIRQKYVWATMVNVSPADGVQMFVTATTYIDEFSQPVKDTTDKINASLGSSTKYIQDNENIRLYTFAGIFVFILIIVFWLAILLARTISRPVKLITDAAQSMETGELSEAEILRLGQDGGKDEVAALSRVFARMAAEVKARENRLKKQVEDLRIEIDHAKKASQVAEITETDYFQTLKRKAKEMREEKSSS